MCLVITKLGCGFPLGRAQFRPCCLPPWDRGYDAIPLVMGLFFADWSTSHRSATSRETQQPLVTPTQHRFPPCTTKCCHRPSGSWSREWWQYRSQYAAIFAVKGRWFCLHQPLESGISCTFNKRLINEGASASCTRYHTFPTHGRISNTVPSSIEATSSPPL